MTEAAHEKSKVQLCMVQLAGLNTPQLNWNRAKMPDRPMPVPPIFRPELAARAIAFLAGHPRRNMWVGVTAALTILGERLARKLLDLFLGRGGAKSEQQRKDLPRSGDNFERPGDDEADRSPRGAFDDKAHEKDPVLWMSIHRRELLLGPARIAWASALLARPGTVVERLGGADERDSRVVLRVLGARHLVQGLVEILGQRQASDLGAAVDLLHALSAVAFAAGDRRWRRPALADAAIAGSFAAAEHRLALRVTTPRPKQP